MCARGLRARAATCGARIDRPSSLRWRRAWAAYLSVLAQRSERARVPEFFSRTLLDQPPKGTRLLRPHHTLHTRLRREIATPSQSSSKPASHGRFTRRARGRRRHGRADRLHVRVARPPDQLALPHRHGRGRERRSSNRGFGLSYRPDRGRARVRGAEREPAGPARPAAQPRGAAQDAQGRAGAGERGCSVCGGVIGSSACVRRARRRAAGAAGGPASAATS